MIRALAVAALLSATVAVTPATYVNTGQLCATAGQGPWCGDPDIQWGLSHLIWATNRSVTNSPGVYYSGAGSYCAGRSRTRCPFGNRNLDAAAKDATLVEVCWTRHGILGIGDITYCAGTPAGWPGNSIGLQRLYAGGAGNNSRWTEFAFLPHGSRQLSIHDQPALIDVSATNHNHGKPLYLCIITKDKSGDPPHMTLLTAFNKYRCALAPGTRGG
jgi:hypothetical protein